MDDRWPYNRKLRRVEPLDRLMWLISIAYASEQNTDGILDGAMIEFVAFLAGSQNPYEAADRLVSAGLWEQDGGRWRVHDYLAFNPSKADRQAERDRKAAAGQLGGREKARSQATSSRELAAARSLLAEQRKQTPSNPLAVPSRPVLDLTPSSSDRAAPASPLLAEPSGSGRGPTDDEDVAALDPRALAALELVAPQVAAAKQARNPRSYARSITADPERRAELDRLARQHPDRDAAWLAREHLGQAHPVEPCSNCRSIAHRAADCPIPPMR